MKHYLSFERSWLLGEIAKARGSKSNLKEKDILQLIKTEVVDESDRIILSYEHQFYSNYSRAGRLTKIFIPVTPNSTSKEAYDIEITEKSKGLAQIREIKNALERFFTEINFSIEYHQKFFTIKKNDSSVINLLNSLTLIPKTVINMIIDYFITKELEIITMDSEPVRSITPVLVTRGLIFSNKEEGEEEEEPEPGVIGFIDNFWGNYNGN